MKERLSNLKVELQKELLSIDTTEQELGVSLTLVEAVMDEVDSVNDLTKEYRKFKHIRKRALFIQENINGYLLGVLNVDNLIEYQDKYLEIMDFDDEFVNPLPLVLASLDKDLIIFQDPKGFIKEHKDILNSVIEKSLSRINSEAGKPNQLGYVELSKKLREAGYHNVPTKLYPKIKKSYKGEIDSEKN